MFRERFCMTCGGPLIRFVWSLSKFNGEVGPPDVCIPKPVAPECLYRCAEDFVRSEEAVQAIKESMDSAVEAAG